MKVFVDTSAWLAVYDASDEHYRNAQHLTAHLKTLRAAYLLSDLVFAETLTMIRYRVGHPAAVRFGRSVLESRLAELVDVDEALRQRAWAIFQRYEDKDFSFVDCTSFAIMESFGVRTAFAFDRHFTQYGFQLLTTGQ